MSLAQRLQERIRARGYTRPDGTPNIKQAAGEAGVSYAAMHALVNGKTDNPTADMLIRLARHFGVTVDWLIEGSDPQPNDRAFRMGAGRIIGAVRERLDELEAALVKSGPADAAGLGIPVDTNIEGRPADEG